MRVTLTAAGDAASYAWSLGDGSTAEGAVVTHVYGAGTFVATVTATNAAGEVAQAQVTVTAVSRTVSLEAPRSAGYGEAGRAHRLAPARRARCTRAGLPRHERTSPRREWERTAASAPGSCSARPGRTTCATALPARAARVIQLRPRIEASLPAVAPVGSRLILRSRLVPAAAGSVTVRVLLAGRQVAGRAGSLRLPTGTPGTVRVVLTARPRPGYAPVRRVLSAEVVVPSLALRLARAERARAGTPARGAALRAPRHRRRLRTRHVRGGPRLPEGARPAADRAGRAVAVAPALAGGRPARPARRRLHRGRQDAPGALRRPRRRGRSGRPRLHRSDRQHAARQLAASTARSAAGTGCSGTRCTSRAASRSTAIRPCPPTPPRTAASGSRCGSRRRSSARTTTARRSWYTSEMSGATRTTQTTP